MTFANPVIHNYWYCTANMCILVLLTGYAVFISGGIILNTCCLEKDMIRRSLNRGGSFMRNVHI